MAEKHDKWQEAKQASKLCLSLKKGQLKKKSLVDMSEIASVPPAPDYNNIGIESFLELHVIFYVFTVISKRILIHCVRMVVLVVEEKNGIEKM